MAITKCFPCLLISSFLAVIFLGCSESDPPNPLTAPVNQTEAIDPNSPPAATTPNFPVNPGPPASIAIGELSEAMPGLPDPSATLKCAVNIRVRDAEGNFVAPGTEVVVYIIPDSIASALPFTIYTDLWGIAEASIYYNSWGTYSLIDITAQCQTPAGIIQAVKEDAVLPLYGGTLDVNTVPSSWYFGSISSVSVTRIQATLTDDLLCPISNALIHFDNSLGLFFCTDSAEAAGTLVNNWNLSGNWVDQTLTVNGTATLFMRAEVFTNYSVNPPYPGIFPDSTVVVVIGEITSDVVGEDIISDPVNIAFRRIL